jgi:hypothetical protein
VVAGGSLGRICGLPRGFAGLPRGFEALPSGSEALLEVPSGRFWTGVSRQSSVADGFRVGSQIGLWIGRRRLLIASQPIADRPSADYRTMVYGLADRGRRTAGGCRLSVARHRFRPDRADGVVSSMACG